MRLICCELKYLANKIQQNILYEKLLTNSLRNVIQKHNLFDLSGQSNTIDASSVKKMKNTH